MTDQYSFSIVGNVGYSTANTDWRSDANIIFNPGPQPALFHCPLYLRGILHALLNPLPQEAIVVKYDTPV